MSEIHLAPTNVANAGTMSGIYTTFLPTYPTVCNPTVIHWNITADGNPTVTLPTQESGTVNLSFTIREEG